MTLKKKLKKFLWIEPLISRRSMLEDKNNKMNLIIKTEVYLITLLLEETEDQLLIIIMIGIIVAEKHCNSMKESKIIIIMNNRNQKIF
jgi:hypothetical protein